MKKTIISLLLISCCFLTFSQDYSYIKAVKSGAALYQHGTITSPVGTDTTISFEGYFGKPLMIFVDFRELDANDSKISACVRGLNMDTVFKSLDSLLFSITIDTASTILNQKMAAFKLSDCYAPILILEYTRGSASPGLEFPVQLFTEK